MVRKPSWIVAWGLAVLLVLLRASDPPKRVLTWDVFGYYLYLPAYFIHDDPALKDHAWLDAVMAKYTPSGTLYQLVDLPDGARMIKYTSGMAAAYAPFFFLAHALAGPLGYPADGFSPPYHYLIAFGCLLYILAGLFILRRALLHFFSERWTALLLALIVLGTNYLHLAVWDGNLLTHPTLFTLYAGLLLATIRWHIRPTRLAALAIGGCAGMIAWIRPPEAIVLLVPLLWGLHGAAERSIKWRLWRHHPLHLVLAAIVLLILQMPQLGYWHALTGEWITNSYANNPGEGFDWLTPHGKEYLFSFRKGWFIYTPLMLLAVMGMPLLWWRHRALFWPLAVFLPLHLWIVSSWTTWWYAGGSFSARSMVPAYVLLAVPLGVLLQRAWRRRALRVPLGVWLVALVLLNLFQTWQWKAGIISKERMTKAYYFATFGRTRVPAGSEDLLLVGRGTTGVETFSGAERYTGRVLFEGDFTTHDPSGQPLTAEEPFVPGLDMPFRVITTKDHAWLRTTAGLWVDSTFAGSPPLIVMTFHHKERTYAYRTGTWEIPPGANGWVRTTMDYLTPEVRTVDDNLKVYIWNKDGGYHRIGDIRVEAYERND